MIAKNLKSSTKGHLNPYKGKENVKWEIRWDLNNSMFAFFLYIKEDNGLMKSHRVLIPNEIIKSALGSKERINEIVEICIDKISKFHGIDFRKWGEK